MTDRYGAGSVLVIGASGFIGTHLVSQLLARQVAVIGLARHAGADRPGLRWVCGDVREPGVMAEALAARPAAVVWASSTHRPADSARDPVGDIEGNLIPLVRCLQQSGPAGVSRFIYLSSGGTVYGPVEGTASESTPCNPVSPYGIGKLAGEKYVRMICAAAGMRSFVLRMSNIYGPGQTIQAGFGFIPTVIGLALAGRPIPLFSGGHDVRDYLHVADAVDALLKALAAEHSGLVNIGSGVGHSGLDVVRLVEGILGRPLALDIQGGRGGDVSRIVLAVAAARECLGWQPRIAMEEGLTSTLEWVRRSMSP